MVRGLKNQYPRDFLFCLEEANLRKDAGEGMAAVAAYREILADDAKPGYFARRGWNWPTLAWATPCAASATTQRRRRPMSRPPGPQRGRELKIRSLLAAGECRDLHGERPIGRSRTIRAAIDAGPQHLARRYRQKASAQPLRRRLSPV